MKPIIKIDDKIYVSLDHVIDVVEVRESKADRQILKNLTNIQDKCNELIETKNALKELLEYFDGISNEEVIQEQKDEDLTEESKHEYE